MIDSLLASLEHRGFWIPPSILKLDSQALCLEAAPGQRIQQGEAHLGGCMCFARSSGSGTGIHPPLQLHRCLPLGAVLPGKKI